jgi:ribonucleotide reductase beta subunit family protein with ferritin-like domain
MGIEILSKVGCKYCDYAEQTCKNLNLEYTRKYVGKSELNRLCGTDESRAYPAVITYPQVLINGVYIGDYNAFEEYIEQSEPMLLPTINRFTVFPIEHENLWALYKKAQMSNWTAEEIDVSSDMEDWNSLSDNERHFIKYVLAFFAGSDGIVFENINNNFADEVQYTEARSFYAYQCHNEMVHGETYSKLIDKYIRDEKEKKSLFEAINNIPSIRDKAMWAMKWFDKSRPFSERLLAFACVEGIFFSGSFCAIFWLKKRGLLPGLCFSNELISRDEGMHLEFAIELFKLLKHKPSQASVSEIVREAVDIEKSFIVDALPCSLIGMNSSKMSDYIEYVSDRLLTQAGFDKIWNTQNPFDFMENISLDGKTNFFEKRVGDYGKIDEHASVIVFDEDF